MQMTLFQLSPGNFGRGLAGSAACGGCDPGSPDLPTSLSKAPRSLRRSPGAAAGQPPWTPGVGRAGASWRRAPAPRWNQHSEAPGTRGPLPASSAPVLAHLKEPFAALTGAHAIVLAGRVVAAHGAQPLVGRGAPRRRRGHLRVEQLRRVTDLQAGETHGRGLSDGVGHSEGLPVHHVVAARRLRVHGDVQGPVEAHLAARHGGAGGRLLKGEEGEAGDRRFPLLNHVRGGHVVLVEVVEGAWVVPHGAVLHLEARGGGRRGRGGLVVNRPGVRHHLLGLGGQVAVLLVAVHLNVFYLNGGLLSGQGHLVQARWLDVVACAVVVHKGTEAGERSGGSDFSVGEVHAKLDKLWS